MSQSKKTPQPRDFRGLTIFELLIIAVIIFGSVFWAFSARSDMRNKAYDEARKGRVSTLKENLRTFYSENGSFPSSEQFENDDSRKKIFALLLADQGEDFLHDPQDKTMLIDYVTDPEDCDGTETKPCQKVALSLKLSNGEEFTKFALEPGKELEAIEEATQNGEVNSEDLVKSLQLKDE